MNLSPLLFTPVLKDYIWGGRNLEKLGRTLPQEGIIAESWEIAAHKDGDTTVIHGEHAGKTLSALTRELGLDLIGTNNAWAFQRDKFPLLIKLLDANRQLSVQVHPNDAFALENEGNELGKTEMWVVLHAEPGAKIQFGVKKGTTPKAFRQGIEQGNLEPHLHYLPVKTGDHVCVPAGSLHAIMEGLMIAEIQQNSNTTYRVYDWNRVGHDGNPRPLHVDKALQVINFAQQEPTLPTPKRITQDNGVTRWELCRNTYFVTERVHLTAGATFKGECDGSTLEIWGLLEGQATINDTALTSVQFCLLPAALGKYQVTAEKDCVLLRSYVPSA